MFMLYKNIRELNLLLRNRTKKQLFFQYKLIKPVITITGFISYITHQVFFQKTNIKMLLTE